MLYVVCCMLYVVCCMMYVVCCMLYVCCTLYVVRCTLYVVCCVLCGVCCMLYVVCCMLYVVCCVLCIVWLYDCMLCVECCMLYVVWLYGCMLYGCMVVCCMLYGCMLYVVCFSRGSEISFFPKPSQPTSPYLCAALSSETHDQSGYTMTVDVLTVDFMQWRVGTALREVQPPASSLQPLYLEGHRHGGKQLKYSVHAMIPYKSEAQYKGLRVLHADIGTEVVKARDMREPGTCQSSHA